MNKKAFTLAELLGVIVLLGIVAIIAITTITTNLKEGRDNTCLAQERNIIEAAKSYIIDHPDELPKEEETKENEETVAMWITVKKLIDDAYLDQAIINPSTEEPYKDGTRVKVMKRGDVYHYDLTYAEGDECNPKSNRPGQIEDNIKLVFGNVTTSENYITVNVTATAKGDIAKYEYAIDGGDWIIGSGNSHTFSGLLDGTKHTIKARVTTEYGNMLEKTLSDPVATQTIKPTIAKTTTGSTSDITFNFPDGCLDRYECTYEISGTTHSVTQNSITETVNGSTTVKTKLINNETGEVLTDSQDINIKYAATFNKGSNVSNIGKTNEECTVAVGSTSCEITLPSITASTGHTSVGWSTTNGATSGTAAGTKITLTGNPTYYANAKANTYTISYNLNSGSYGSSHPTSATYNKAFTVNNPTRSGYSFSGWNITGMDSTTHTYGSSTTTATSLSGRKETSFKNLRATSGTVTFTAVWAQNKVTITSSKNRNTTDGYQSCKSNWFENRYNFTINYNGSSASSGKMCYATSSSSYNSSYCGNYKTNTNTGAGVACFNSATNWKFYRATACAYAYAKAANGASASKYQC